VRAPGVGSVLARPVVPAVCRERSARVACCPGTVLSSACFCELIARILPIPGVRRSAAASSGALEPIDFPLARPEPSCSIAESEPRQSPASSSTFDGVPTPKAGRSDLRPSVFSAPSISPIVSRLSFIPVLCGPLPQKGPFVRRRTHKGREWALYSYLTSFFFCPEGVALDCIRTSGVLPLSFTPSPSSLAKTHQDSSLVSSAYTLSCHVGEEPEHRLWLLGCAIARVSCLDRAPRTSKLQARDACLPPHPSLLLLPGLLPVPPGVGS